MDLLAQGHAWLDRQRRAYASQDVRYARGTDVLASVPATLSRTPFQVVADLGGMPTEVVSQDFIITAADLVLPSAGLTEPKKGDRVTWNGSVYEVMPFGGESHWRWADPARAALRIHTKQVE